jgi:hypothetical protein
MKMVTEINKSLTLVRFGVLSFNIRRADFSPPFKKILNNRVDTFSGCELLAI